MAVGAIVVPEGAIAQPAHSRAGRTIDDVQIQFLARADSLVVVYVDEILADSMARDAEIARCLVFKGQSLVALGRDGDALKAFKQARKRDPKIVPSEAWRSAKARAIWERSGISGPKWPLFAMVGAAAGLIYLLWPNGDGESVADLPGPPDPPSLQR